MVDGGHKYTGVRGKVIVDGSIEGFVEADFKMEFDMGKYIEQGSDSPIDHTFGMRKVSGKITKGWGMNSGYFYEWFINQQQKSIVFRPDKDQNLYAEYTVSGASIKSMGSGIKAGDGDALIMECEFEGLGFSSTDIAE